MKKYYLGIDPGKSGGIAVLTEDGEVEYLRSMPETDSDIWHLIDNIPIGMAVIEKVGPRPAMGGPVCALCHRPVNVVQGIKSTFSFGYSVGFLRACIIAAEIPFEETSPQRWQKALRVKSKLHTESHPQFKSRLKSIAQRLFPTVHVTLKTADALLISEYCRRLYSSRPRHKGA